jgi:hypothetical protein
MKIRRWMAIIGGLAVASWLAIPSIRIWRDPSVLAHRHSIDSADPSGKLEMRWETATPGVFQTLETDSILLLHEIPFWVYYQRMLLGQPRPEADQCRSCADSLAQIHEQVKELAPAKPEPNSLESCFESRGSTIVRRIRE